MKRGADQLASGFVFIEYERAGKSPEQIRQELNAKAAADEIDAYLVIPADIEAPSATFEFRSRKAGDFVANETLKDAAERGRSFATPLGRKHQRILAEGPQPKRRVRIQSHQ